MSLPILDYTMQLLRIQIHVSLSYAQYRVDICVDHFCPYQIKNLFKNLGSLKSY